MGALAAGASSSSECRSWCVFERTLDRNTPLVETHLPVTWSFLQPEHVDALERLRPGLSALAEHRFALRDRCFAGWVGDRIVSVRWVVRGALREDAFEYAFSLGDDEAYLYDAFTDPDRRGARLGSAGGTRLAAILADEGCIRSVALVNPWNEAGIRNVVHNGYNRSGAVVILFRRFSVWLPRRGRPRRGRPYRERARASPPRRVPERTQAALERARDPRRRRQPAQPT